MHGEGRRQHARVFWRHCAKSGDAAFSAVYQESSATAAVAEATVDSQTQGIYRSFTESHDKGEISIKIAVLGDMT